MENERTMEFNLARKRTQKTLQSLQKAMDDDESNVRSLTLRQATPCRHVPSTMALVGLAFLACLVVGGILTDTEVTKLTHLGLRDLRNSSDESLELNDGPKRRKGRSHSPVPSQVGHFQLEGLEFNPVNISGVKYVRNNRIVKPATDLSVVNTTFKDWQRPFWLKDVHSDVFEQVGEGILVKRDAIYWAYSLYHLYGRGSRCAYELRFGADPLDSHKCVDDREMNDMPGFRPCYLGFVQMLRAGTVLKMVYLDSEQCGGDKLVSLKISYMGLILVMDLSSQSQEKWY